MQQIMVKNREGDLIPADIKQIQSKTAKAVKGLSGVSQDELETDAGIQFYTGMTTKEVQQIFIKTAVDKIDIDAPNWTYVASRMFFQDIYHDVGKLFNGKKGDPYSHTLKEYLDYGVTQGRINESFSILFDLEDLNNYIEPDRDLKFNYLGIKTFYDRYMLKDKEGMLFELPQHMFMAVSMFLAQREENPGVWAKKFYDMISKFEVMLATPTLSNARTNRNQLSSCYANSVPDNIEGIFDAFKDYGLLSKFGGGIGTDWANVRAGNSIIDDHKGAAGGYIPFLKIVNDIALAVDQLGVRKGSIAIYTEPWHLDIQDFIDLKKNSGEERRRAHDLFPSIWMNGLFMDRAEADEEWTLFDPYETPDLHEKYGDEFKLAYESYEKNPNIRKEVIKAKDLWKKILTSYFEVGMPFLAFKDEANRRNQNKHSGIMRSSNLCQEIFQVTSPNEYGILAEFEDGGSVIFEEFDELIVSRNGIESKKLGKKVSNIDSLLIDGELRNIEYISKIIVKRGRTLVCNLASVNLSKINTDEDFAKIVPTAVRALDNVIDLNLYPIRQAKETNKLSRAIGLGVMGEAQMIAESGGIVWGSQEHFEKIDEIMENLSYHTVKSSAMLAKEKGSYPEFEGSEWSKGIIHYDTANIEAIKLTNRTPNEERLSELRKLAKEGMRNGYLMAVAPTGTISIVVGTTQTIEPVYKRKWMEENLSGLIPVVAPNLSPDTWQGYVPAYEVDQISLIKAAAIRQKWIDQGQSLNVFIPTNKASGKYFNAIYVTAYKLGLKSTYYLRSESPEIIEDDEAVNDRSIECKDCQ